MRFTSINGVPSCANKKLLTDVARGEWGFKGYVISDSGAIVNIMTHHNYTHNLVDTATVAIKAGTNIELTSRTRVFDSIVSTPQPRCPKAYDLEYRVP